MRKNKEFNEEYHRQYYRDNRERILKRKKETSKEYRKNNPEKIKKYQKQYEILNKEERKYAHIKRSYGLTIDEYNQLFDKQKGCCAICGKHQNDLKQPISVDHDHITRKVRGLLCFTCNLILGLAKDDINLLKKSIEYLNNL